MSQMPAKQSTTSKESRRITPIGNTTRILKLALISLVYYQSQIEKMLLWLLWIDSPKWLG